MSSEAYPSFDVKVVAPALESLHEHVTRTKARIEITRPGTDELCVLLSKEELACLERALEILSQSDQYHAISRKISALAAQTTMLPLAGA